MYGGETKIKRKLLLVLALALILSLAGCGPGEVKGDRERITDPQVKVNEMSTLINGKNSFAFDLYQELKVKDGNLLNSPYSISLAPAPPSSSGHSKNHEQTQELARRYLWPDMQ